MRMVVVLPEPVRPEEAENRAALDLHGQVAHHLPPAERFGQAVHIDHDLGRGRRRVCGMCGHNAHRGASGLAATVGPAAGG
jgi:hypothetical protein